jgi:alkylation response protein AidB-like acyl-CoA dehydrogenase
MYLPRTAEQDMLAESALRFLRERTQPSWAEMREMGWVAAAFDDSCGGLAGGAADIACLCEAFGEAGARVPFFSTVLLPAMLIRRLPDAGVRSELAGKLIDGATGIAVAHQEAGSGFDAHAPCEVRADEDGTLTGAKRRVWDATGAEPLIVSAKSTNGVGLYLVAPDAPGCIFATNGDATLPAAQVTFARVPARCLAAGEIARRALADAAAFALTGVMSETLGLMRAAFEATREWLATRRQFGRALADNQVLQHRLADMFIAIEESRSMMNLAIHAFDHGAAQARAPALHAARVHIANAARMVGQSAVHLHGAMGITEELAAGRAYRRMEALGAVFGGVDHHVSRYAEIAFGTGVQA